MPTMRCIIGSIHINISFGLQSVAWIQVHSNYAIVKFDLGKYIHTYTLFWDSESTFQYFLISKLFYLHHKLAVKLEGSKPEMTASWFVRIIILIIEISLFSATCNFNQYRCNYQGYISFWAPFLLILIPHMS